MITKCINCNKEFNICINDRNYKLFCSNKCLNEYTENQKICPQCKKYFYNNKKFCSTKYKCIYNQSIYHKCCTNCGNEFTTKHKDTQFCCRACSAAFSSRFHHMGFFIKNEDEWYHLDKPILESKFELPTNLSSLNDYFSGYYMDIHHEVRSGSEHNIARILQLCGIDYDYELYTFKLTNNKTYRPDFYLPNEDIFYEMKGEWRGDSFEKLNLFHQMYPSIKLILIDMKTYLNIERWAKLTFPYINFDLHIRIKNQLIKHIPQFRYLSTNCIDSKYWYFTNKVDINLIDDPIILSKELEEELYDILKQYRNNGKIYYAIDNDQYIYDKKDINIIKDNIKKKTNIVIPTNFYER